ncbi:MAG: ABC transporter ATP-binding protein [Acidobacteria bacterium]|nr:ABC transporter ATP-binding protein [Acidobacteriota bacterium]
MSSQPKAQTSLLSIEGLSVEFADGKGRSVKAVRDVSLEVKAGEMLAVVGESGSGKTALAMSIVRLLPNAGRVTSGAIRFDGADLLTADAASLRSVRGKRIGVVFQDPMSSLNPYLNVGRQITEVTELHLGLSRREAREHAIEMLDLVGISEPSKRIDQYPHEFSGGMRQRVMIAIAVSCKPDLVIADEPTTALDSTIQAQVLDLLDGLRKRFGMTVLLISHDLALVSGRADRVAVMYGGRIFEEANSREIFSRSANPYTRALLSAMPENTAAGEELFQIPGMPPDLRVEIEACEFAPRCERAEGVCGTARPPFAAVADQHFSRCHFAEDVYSRG